MNPLKKGPEIKLSELKVPDFVLDIYYELRERHLLPLVAVLLVAIVAVPIALSESVEPVPVGVEPSPAQANASSIVVAKSTPGLRDYQQRLSHLKAKDPFKQQVAAAEEAGVTGEAEEAHLVNPEAGGGSVPSEPGGSSPAPPTEQPEGGGSQTEGEHKLRYYTWVIDVRVVPVSSNGKKSKGKPYTLHEQPPLTMLPGRETPALVYIGPTKDGKKALMLVSSNVKSTFGDNICVLGGETCQMLALEPNTPETLVYGGNERVFRIELSKIKLVVSKEVNEASLGKSNGSKGSGQANEMRAPTIASGQPK
jgi:hypothetical protein